MSSIPLRTATIRDVARLAEVSPAAVSRYLNNQLQLSAMTEARIESAIKSLNYVPNAIARRLSRSSSETIGFITSDIVYPFFASIASAAEEAASEAGYSLTIFNSRNDTQRELQFLSRIDDRQVDGVLLLTNHADDGQLRDKINATPRVVLLDEDVPGAKAPRIFAENIRGAEMATHHLIERGHRRIGYIGGPRGLLSGDERLEGFRRAHAAAQLVVDEDIVVSGAYDEAAAYRGLLHLLGRTEPPTAVFSGGDLLAMGIMRAARDSGLRIPDDLSLVSFDDMPHAGLFDPPLTTVRQSSEEFGRRGVELLLDLLANVEVPRENPRIRVDLIIRDSVSAPSVRKTRNRGTRTRGSRSGPTT
jgi:LacI family transcriptional regulator